MTGNKTLFSIFFPKEEGFVSYGDNNNNNNNKGKILGFGTIGKFQNPRIMEVLLLKWLKQNFPSTSQLCDKHNNVTFDSSSCRFIKWKSNKTLFTSSRSGNTYTINLNKISSNDACLLINEDKSWIKHRRISYIHTDHQNELVCKDHVDGLPNLHLEKNRLCDAYQKGIK